MSIKASPELSEETPPDSNPARIYLVAAALFVAAILPRLPGLDRFLTSDERTNIFFAGSDVIAAFLQGDWRETYWHFYPGVTMSWLDALGMGGQYLLDLLQGKPLSPFQDYIYGDILSLLAANRLPYAILTAAAVPVIYLLMRQLVASRVALLGALFMAFDPFYLAHSRVAHGDAPVAVFMTISALALFIYYHRIGAWPAGTRLSKSGLLSRLPPLDRYLIVSAVCGSLAALTKAPGQFMAPFVTGLSLCYGLGEIWRIHRQREQQPERFRLSFWAYALRLIGFWLSLIVIWGLIALGVFILVWPSMWVDPLGTMSQMLGETFSKVNEGHLVFYFGQPTLDPGPWFYFYVIPFRLTPVVLAGVVFSLLLLFGPGFNHLPEVQKLINPRRLSLLRSPHFLLWLFSLTLLLFGNLSPKKQDRYLLPLFPLLDFLAASGWYGLLAILGNGRTTLRLSYDRDVLKRGLIVALLLFHITPALSYYPYYLTYFNPLMGGPTRAAQTTLMGWGEGMEQAAHYLNTRPNAERLFVASTPSQTLLPFFAGTGENFYTNDIALRADYVVLYLAQIQRLAPSPEIVRYFERQTPEETIIIKDVVYAKIYPGPKLIMSEMPARAVPVNIGLDELIRLAGFDLADLAETGQVELLLHWQALASLPADYTISVRAKAADGRILTQQDRWPVEGLLPTSQWRPGDYVADRYLLDLPPADGAAFNTFEIVVYNAGTGQTLGQPIVISREHD